MADKPEECTRVEIDRLLAAANWSVQHVNEANIHTERGTTIREFRFLGGNFAFSSLDLRNISLA